MENYQRFLSIFKKLSIMETGTIEYALNNKLNFEKIVLYLVKQKENVLGAFYLEDGMFSLAYSTKGQD